MLGFDWHHPKNVDEEAEIEEVFSQLFSTLRGIMGNTGDETFIVDFGDTVRLGKLLIAAISMLEAMTVTISRAFSAMLDRPHSRLDVLDDLERVRPRFSSTDGSSN